MAPLKASMATLVCPLARAASPSAIRRRYSPSATAAAYATAVAAPAHRTTNAAASLRFIFDGMVTRTFSNRGQWNIRAGPVSNAPKDLARRSDDPSAAGLAIVGASTVAEDLLVKTTSVP